MPVYEYECKVCGRAFEEFKYIKDRNDVFCCGKRSDKLITQVYTNPDLSYNFMTEMFNGGKPMYIRSGRHYREMLKKHNMPDASPVECKQEAGKKKRWKEEENLVRIQKTANEIVKDMKRDNVNHVAKDALEMLVKGGMKKEERPKYFKESK